MYSRKEKSPSLILFFLALISHLPFLWAGYGREEDAWAQALNAKIIWESGVYEVSRLPGHPLYELLLAALWPIHHSYFFFNLLSALATSAAVVVFYKIAKKLVLTNAFGLSLAFSFVPVIFIAGNYTIDYNFALLFILASFFSLLKRKFILAGILLGIATGFRISSLGFLLPFTLMLWSHTHFKKLLTCWVMAGITAFISFLPPLLTYGMGFLDFHKPPFPSWAQIIYELSFGIWGVPLLIALGVLAAFGFMNKKTLPHLRASWISEKQFIAGVLLIWLLQFMVFLRLPFKAEFFIPAVPFLLMLFGVYLRKSYITWLAAASFLSCFLFGFDYSNPYRGSDPSPLALKFAAGGKDIFLDPIQGPAILDMSKRENKSVFLNMVLEWKAQRNSPTWLIAGWYWPELMLKTEDTSLVKMDYYSTSAELRKAAENGREIFYLPEINESNAKINAHYLADSLGQELSLQ